MPVAAALLVAAFVPLAVRYSHDAAWRVPADQRPFVDRALAGAADAFGSSPEDYRRLTRPRVHRRADRICVDLLTAHASGDGSFLACYDRSGRRLSERAIGPSFGPNRISDKLRALIW